MSEPTARPPGTPVELSAKPQHEDGKRVLGVVPGKPASGERKVIRVYQRASTIVPEFIGHNFEIYNGRKWFPLFVSEELVGHKFGEFAPTRQFRSHSRDERKAKK